MAQMEVLALITKYSIWENILDSFVFKCEKCGGEIRLIVAKFNEDKLSSRCFKCDMKRNFVFTRKGNQGEDWLFGPNSKNSSKNLM